jgi:hypothetical protein
MTYADKIILAFGGVRALARRLGRAPSTVGSWADRGSIPDDDKAAILAIALQDGVPLSAEDFFPFERMPDGTPPPDGGEAAKDAA